MKKRFLLFKTFSLDSVNQNPISHEAVGVTASRVQSRTTDPDGLGAVPTKKEKERQRPSFTEVL